jgi:protein ImuB
VRLLYLDWPHLPHRIEAERAAPAGLPELVVIGGQAWEKGEVLDCSPAAARLGVTRGQPLGSAHRLVPDAVFLPADLPTYRARLAAALELLSRFTPALEGDDDPTGAGFGRLLLGIEGLHRLWGDEAVLARRVIAALQPKLPGWPRAGVGNTRFGAQVAAVVSVARGGWPVLEAIPAGDAPTEAAYLAPLPIRLLPADAETRERLRVFGLTRIGEFAELPRSAVLARFGAPGGVLHDLARGLDGRPLRPRRPIERLRIEAELEPAVEEIEPLRFVLRKLCSTLCEQLVARGAGAGEARLELELERATSLVLTQALPEPAAAPELLERLLLARLIASPPTSAVTRLVLELSSTAPAAGQQLHLFTPQLARAGELEWQLTGLALRFGPNRLLRAQILDPEAGLAGQRFELRPASST